MPSLSSSIYMELCICLAMGIAHSVSSTSVLKYLCTLICFLFFNIFLVKAGEWSYLWVIAHSQINYIIANLAFSLSKDANLLPSSY